MAVVTLTPEKIVENIAKVVTMTASTTDGVEFIVPVGCESFYIIFNNTGASAYDITLQKPAVGGHASSPANGAAVEIAADGIAVLFVETARWMNHSTRKVLIDSENAGITAGVVHKF